MLFKAAFSALSPAGPRGRLSILIFHRVLPAADPLFPGEITQPQFDAICTWLRQWFNVLPLDLAAARLQEGTLPSRALCITFDDGYADNHDVALPVLQRHGLCATFFVATGFLDGGRMWNDTLIECVRRAAGPTLDLAGTPAAGLGSLPLGSIAQRQVAIARAIGAAKYLPPPERDAWVDAFAARTGAALPDDLMMRSSQVRQLHQAGMQIGGHTVGHPILARLAVADITHEIAEGRRQLQDIVAEPVTLFAYPNGKPGEDYDDRAVQAVREQGFKVAVSTTWGTSDRRSDPLQLPRFTPWDRQRARFGLRLARMLAQR